MGGLPLQDRYRGRLPELERCMIRHRALQIILIIYHAEELKQEVVETVNAQGRLKGAVSDDDRQPEEDAPDRKKVKCAFDCLVKDGVLTPDERREMVTLIGRRNSIAHHLDQVSPDLIAVSWVRDHLAFLHDYEAFDRLDVMRRLLEERTIAKHYAGVTSMRGIFFEATERALRYDINRLDRRIRKLVRERHAAIQALNYEQSFEGTELIGVFQS